MKKERLKMLRDLDIVLFIAIIIATIFGLVVLKSATLSMSNSARIMKAQTVATLLGFAVLIVLTLIEYRIWKHFYIPIYALCIVLLAATLIKGSGASIGSQSWLKIGPIRFQPSEFVKVGLIISLSAYIENHYENINKPLVLLKVLIFAFLPVVLILMQPDAGTAMVYIFFILIMLFVSGINWKYIVSAVVAGVAMLPIIWVFLNTYQKNRILDFLNPTENATSSSYQFIEGRIAIGSGKLTGKGLYQGTQTQYNFIPEKQNDFIFPVLVEELGFIGGFSLIFLYGLILFRMYKISTESADVFGSLMVVGFAAMFLFHIWENIGMTLGVMPITGIPLPFISSGGTFQLINLAILGLVLSVSLHKNQRYY